MLGGLFTGLLVALGLGAVAAAVIYAVKRTTPAQNQIQAAANSASSFLDQIRTNGIFGTIFGTGPTGGQGLPSGYNPATDPARWGSFLSDTIKAVPDIIKIANAGGGSYQTKPDEIFGTLPSGGGTKLLPSSGSSGGSSGSGGDSSFINDSSKVLD